MFVMELFAARSTRILPLKDHYSPSLKRFLHFKGRDKRINLFMETTNYLTKIIAGIILVIVLAGIVFLFKFADQNFNILSIKESGIRISTENGKKLKIMQQKKDIKIILPAEGIGISMLMARGRASRNSQIQKGTKILSFSMVSSLRILMAPG